MSIMLALCFGVTLTALVMVFALMYVCDIFRGSGRGGALTADDFGFQLMGITTALLVLGFAALALL